MEYVDWIDAYGKCIIINHGGGYYTLYAHVASTFVKQGQQVELGDVIQVREEYASFPIFRHNGREAEMVMAELAGDFEAPLYGMLAVADALDAMEWEDGTKPEIRLNGQPEDESFVTLLWDGEWEVTWITFRDMGAALAIALLAIYILVVGQFGSFKLPLVILTPIPLTFLGIIGGHWLFQAPFSATSMIGFMAGAGIVVRNSIILVDFIQLRVKEGMPLLEAVVDRFFERGAVARSVAVWRGARPAEMPAPRCQAQ